jgi:hypothetical protein
VVCVKIMDAAARVHRKLAASTVSKIRTEGVITGGHHSFLKSVLVGSMLVAVCPGSGLSAARLKAWL